MTPSLRDAFEQQAMICAKLGSPFMERALPLMLDAACKVPILADTLRSYPLDRLPPTADAPALRLAAGFHKLALQSHHLADAYPPNSYDNDTLFRALCCAAQDHPDTLLKSLQTAPQTNEIRRSAVLIAVAHWLTARFGKMLVLSELGCSAGLNLNWDFYRMDVGNLTFGPQKSSVQLSPQWRGCPPTLCPAYVHQSRGIDLNPPNIMTPDGQLTLLSYLWPDQPDRLALTRAGLHIANQPDSEHETQVLQGDAIHWLPTRLEQKAPYLHMIYSTIAWQYLPADAKTTGERMICAAGAKATKDAPMAWFMMENDGQTNSAALTLRLWPGDIIVSMGRADFHGRWIDWQAPLP